MERGIYLFVLRENKRVKPASCSKAYLQTSLIPKLSRSDTPGPSLKRRRAEVGGRMGKGEEEVASWL